MDGYDLITFTGTPAATSPFFIAGLLEGARIAPRCDTTHTAQAAANRLSTTAFACFLGHSSPDLVCVWRHQTPALTLGGWSCTTICAAQLASGPFNGDRDCAVSAGWQGDSMSKKSPE
jgi:hypothetical protein